MGIELAKAFVRVRSDASLLPGDLSQIRSMVAQTMDDVSTQATGAASKISGVMKDWKAYATAALAPVAAMGQNFLNAGEKSASFMEDTTLNFTRLIGDADQAQATIKNLSDFAAETPFEMPQLLTVSQELINFGERGDGMMETVKMLGDASGGSAQKFGMLGLVFNQVRGVGKLLTQDFRQLSTRGIISMQDFVKAGIAPTTEAATKMMSSGKISFEDFKKTLASTTQEGGKNFNAMAQAALTLTGRQSTLSDAIGILGRKVSESSMPFTKFVVDVKIKMVEALDFLVTATDGAAGAAAIGAIKFAQLGVALYGGAVAARFFGFSLRAAIIGTGVGAVVLALGAAIGVVVNWLSKSVVIQKAVAVAADALTIAWKNISSALVVLQSTFAELFETVFGTTVVGAMEGAAQYIATWIIWFSEKMVQASEWIIYFADGIGFYIRNGVNIAKIAFIDLTLAFSNFVGEGSLEKWAANFIGAFAGIRAFFGSFISNVRGGFLEMFNAIKAGVVGLVAAVKSISDTVNSIMDGAEDRLASIYAFAIAKAQGLDPVEVEKTLREDQERLNKRRGGKDWDQIQGPIDAFLAAAGEELAGQKDVKADNAFAEFAQAQDKARLEALAGFEDMGGLNAGLQAEKDRLLEAIARREEEHANKLKKPGAPDDETPGKKEKDKKDAEAEKDAGLKQGRFGFAQLGTSIQDAILKKDGDKLGSIVTLTEASNKIQAGILKNSKDDKKGTLGP